MPWISVDEAMPLPGVYVDGWVEEVGIAEGCRWADLKHYRGRWYWIYSPDEEEWLAGSCRVTHWMPIPGPPSVVYRAIAHRRCPSCKSMNQAVIVGGEDDGIDVLNDRERFGYTKCLDCKIAWGRP